MIHIYIYIYIYVYIKSNQIRKIENWLIKSNRGGGLNRRRSREGGLQIPSFITSFIGAIKYQFTQIRNEREQERYGK